MTDKIMPEDRHIEAAIRAADLWTSGWTAHQVRELSKCPRPPAYATSVMAHAKTLAILEAEKAAWANAIKDSLEMQDVFRAALSSLKDK